jgi:Dihydroxynaphthoic acid synthase
MAKGKTEKNNPGNGGSSSHEFQNILYEKKDRVARVTINRPEVRNALNSKVREELAIAIEDAWLDV